MTNVNTSLTKTSHFAIGICFLIAFLLRLIWLDHIPGINGDEAWYGLMTFQPINLHSRTPTGNVLNVFYLINLFLIQKLFDPHFWILRSVSALSGIALICAGYFLMKGYWGELSSRFFLFLSMSMPILVAYSRFGWDASQTGLISLFLLYFSLKKQWVSAALAQIISMIIHPANLLLVFIPLVLFLLDVFGNAQRKVKKILLSILAVGMVLLFAGFYLFYAHQESLADWFTAHGITVLGTMLLEIKPEEIVARLTSASGWGSLLVLYGDLISGTTIYRYIVGPLSGWNAALHSILFWVIILPLMVYGCWREIRRQQFQTTSIFLGLLLGLVLMYLLFGTHPISPHFERYSLFLVVPTLLLLVRGLDLLPNSKTSHTLAVFIGVVWLFSVVFNYFIPFQITGGMSHRAFRTASVEPKEQAVNFILEQTQNSDREVVVLAEDWWLTMPMSYLLINDTNISVIQLSKKDKIKDFINVFEQGGFVVTFSGSEFDHKVAANCPADQCEKKIILDYGSVPLITIWHQSSQ